MTDLVPSSTAEARTCKICKKKESPKDVLKGCGRCGCVFYCSKDCQKADWKTHKRICLDFLHLPPWVNQISQIRSKSASQPNSEGSDATQTEALSTLPTATSEDLGLEGFITRLEADVKTPFTRLAAKRWLHGRPEKDVFKILIGTIYIRSFDDKDLAEQSLMDLFEVSKSHAARMLVVRFLREADNKGLLPSWWSPGKEVECIKFSLRGKNWANMERLDSEHQGLQPQQGPFLQPQQGPLFLLQMRMFAEQVYGVIAGKQSVMPRLELHLENERQELIGNLLTLCLPLARSG